ncbi:flagellar motor switch protein FliN [Geomicrobium sp. JCM 19037]|uniref:flagellar motor switch phosphatase FliY n=1 Tax=Geomicrobium sp. JCM 19037 TaxID=1460634 RepID=UPI00045F2BED|nr:flagellar motor switch phosphatase FliY [Geomicrobium sp. JCM 19037]GAK02046.1 flagellar motor switch protein FliN [Geomicrobium sp. JCM 19037]
MNDEPLSQEEINQLLQGLEDEAEAERTEKTDDGYPPAPTRATTDIQQFLTEIEKDAIGEIGNISFGTAATTLSQLLNQKVSITTPIVQAVKSDLLQEEFPAPHVSVHVQYKEGFEGTNVLVIKEKDAQIIADLMLGGDGTEPSSELGEMHISAVQEAMNQMMGSSSTSLSTIFNTRVDISPPGITMLDVEAGDGIEQLPNEATLIKISFRLKIGELIDSIIMQLVTVEFAKEMVELLMNPGDNAGAVEAPAMPVEEKTVEHASHPEPTRLAQETSVPPSPPSAHERQERLHEEFAMGDREVQPAQFASFEEEPLTRSQSRNLNMLMDIPLDVTVELGRTRRSIKDILSFTQGSIIELDKLAGEPVDIMVNHRLVAKGEVVVIDENFGVRVTDIVSQAERLENLK